MNPRPRGGGLLAGRWTPRTARAEGARRERPELHRAYSLPGPPRRHNDRITDTVAPRRAPAPVAARRDRPQSPCARAACRLPSSAPKALRPQLRAL